MKKVLFGTLLMLLLICTIIFTSCDNRVKDKNVIFEEIRVNKYTHIDNNTSSPKCNVDIQLMVASVANGKIADKINDAIVDKIFGMHKKSVKMAIDSFTNNYLKDYRIHYGSFYEEDKKDPCKKNMYQFHYNLKSEVHTGKLNIVNYILKENFYEGGAHDIKQTIVLNFNPHTGKVITINDVFVPGYEKTLNELLLISLFKKTGSQNIDELKSKGYLVSENIYAPENFILGEDKITFIYNPYEVAPYTLGNIMLEINYSDINKILTKDYD